MCDLEGVQTLQRGMNYRMKPTYSVVLMSRRSNAPYADKIHEDGITLEYEGHDVARKSYDHNPKADDQPSSLPSGKLTQNGYFIKAAEDYKNGIRDAECVKVYEKIMPGVWSLKGIFNLIDYKTEGDANRNVFKFILQLSPDQNIRVRGENIDLPQTRVIPSEVKKNVWKRDLGKCTLCGSTENLHFDHELPYSKGGTSLSEKNVRLLCMVHNLQKSAKIE